VTRDARKRGATPIRGHPEGGKGGRFQENPGDVDYGAARKFDFGKGKKRKGR